MRDALLQRRQQLGQQLAQVAGQRRDALRALGVGRVIGQRLAVVLDHHAAARGVHHDGLDLAALDQRPPGVDVAAHVGQPARAVAEVAAQRAAAARAVGDQGLDAGGVEHARGRAVDVGRQRRLHAAQQQQDLARVRAGRPVPGARPRARRHLGLQRGRHQRPRELPQAQRRREQRRSQALLEQPARAALGRRARHARIDHMAADVDQPTVLDPARAGRLAVAAGQAAVEVQLRAARDRRAFEHLLDQVDAPARPVELVAEQLVGRAGRGAEAAVHAFAQDGLGLATLAGVLELGG